MGKISSKNNKKTSTFGNVTKILLSILIGGGIIGVVFASYLQEPLVIQGSISDAFGAEKISFWKRDVQMKLVVENKGQYPIITTVNEETVESEVLSDVNILIKNEKGETVFDENRPFTEVILSEGSKNVPLEFTIPENIDNGTLIIGVSCSSVTYFRRCDSQIPKIKHTFEVIKTGGWEILGIDATRRGIDELSFFREDIGYNFGITDTTSIYKTIPAGIEFPAFHRDPRENWGGIILFYNPALGHQGLSDTTRKIQSVLGARYHLPVVLKEYNQKEFDFYTDRFFECKPSKCVTNTLAFKDLRSGTEGDENLFSKTIFTENPNLDFMFILPYNNQK